MYSGQKNFALAEKSNSTLSPNCTERVNERKGGLGRVGTQPVWKQGLSNLFTAWVRPWWNWIIDPYPSPHPLFCVPTTSNFSHGNLVSRKLFAIHRPQAIFLRPSPVCLSHMYCQRITIFTPWLPSGSASREGLASVLCHACTVAWWKWEIQIQALLGVGRPRTWVFCSLGKYLNPQVTGWKGGRTTLLHLASGQSMYTWAPISNHSWL